MLRRAAVLAGLLGAAPAFAADAPDVCILQVTETFTRPAKPNIVSTKMDCGAEPTRDEAQALVAVSNLPNAADAVSYMLGKGWSMKGVTTHIDRSGGARYHFYTFAERAEPMRPAAPPAMGMDAMPMPMDPPAAPAEDEGDLEDLDPLGGF